MSFGPALRNKAEAILAARKDKPEFVDYEFKDYKGKTDFPVQSHTTPLD